MTLAEKLISRNIGGGKVTAGDIVMVSPDSIMIHDIFIPFVADKFYEMGFKKVWDPDRAAIIFDHLIPTGKAEDIRHLNIAKEFAREQEISRLHQSDGICHQLMHEKKYVLPGQIAVGTDSHTVTYGALGAFSSGLGYTDIASILGIGKTWMKVPETIRVEINGKLRDGVYAKDVILKMIGDLKADGASYKAIEFTGSTIEEMSMASRFTMSNMVVEAGAKAGLFYPDKKTCEYSGISEELIEELREDGHAQYYQVIQYQAEDFEPVVAVPSNVDNVKPVSGLGSIKVDQVFIGSCTNGRLEDLEVAARILKGRRVHEGVKLIITPASREIYEQAAAMGILTVFLEAGGIITHPGCGLCCGRSGGIIGDNETLVATNNRNFLGRMGSETSYTYLASPSVAAATAIKGMITDEKGL